MKFNSKNSFQSLDTLNSSGKDYKIFNLKTAEKNDSKNNCISKKVILNIYKC